MKDLRSAREILINELVEKGVYDQRIATAIHTSMLLTQNEIEWELEQLQREDT